MINADSLKQSIETELTSLRSQLKNAVGKEYAAGLRGQIMALHKVLRMIEES